MFATCSKDGYILVNFSPDIHNYISSLLHKLLSVINMLLFQVWQSQYPVTIKYLHDMKTFSWKYTQFSQFNCTDTLLLVSGVHFGTPHSTSGEIAVFKVARK